MQEYDFYVDKDGHDQAVANSLASISSDLGKHPQTQGSVKVIAMLGLGLVMGGNMRDRAALQKFIDGIN